MSLIFNGFYYHLICDKCYVDLPFKHHNANIIRDVVDTKHNWLRVHGTETDLCPICKDKKVEDSSQ